MGYMCNHAIIVDSWNAEAIIAAHAEAKEIFAGVAPVTEITPPTVNFHTSFMVAPDGSKEGWAESDAGDNAREAFKSYLRSVVNSDGGTYLNWVEVLFGDEEGACEIVAHDAEEPA